MSMEVVVPDDCMGDVIGDLNSRRGKVLGVDPKSGGTGHPRPGADGGGAQVLAGPALDDQRPRLVHHGLLALRGAARRTWRSASSKKARKPPRPPKHDARARGDGSEDPNAIAESVERGDDPYTVPEEMLVEPEPDKPVNKSLYDQIVHMKIGERVKLALKGNREARYDSDPRPESPHPALRLLNPRITDDEVLFVSRATAISTPICSRHDR